MNRKPPRRAPLGRKLADLRREHQTLPDGAAWANNAALTRRRAHPYAGIGPKFEVGPLPLPRAFIVFEPIPDELMPWWKRLLGGALNEMLRWENEQ